jgi:exodeoxyribonuclease V alpha subunit
MALVRYEPAASRPPGPSRSSSARSWFPAQPWGSARRGRCAPTRLTAGCRAGHVGDRLARDIRGIGFKTADAIAMRLGIDTTAMVRVRAGISEAMDEGHCGLPTEDLMPLAGKLLEVTQGLIRTALNLELADGAVIADRVGDKLCVFLTGVYRAERGIGERLLQLGTGKLAWPSSDPDKAIPWIEQRAGLVVAESQRSAVAVALTSKVLVMTGGSGVGKTTLVNAILRILSAKGMRLLLCAPTGRAAKRMNEATGFEAKPSTACSKSIPWLSAG